MYYIYGQSGPSLLIESTDSMIDTRFVELYKLFTIKFQAYISTLSAQMNIIIISVYILAKVGSLSSPRLYTIDITLIFNNILVNIAITTPCMHIE